MLKSPLTRSESLPISWQAEDQEDVQSAEEKKPKPASTPLQKSHSLPVKLANLNATEIDLVFLAFILSATHDVSKVALENSKHQKFDIVLAYFRNNSPEVIEEIKTFNQELKVLLERLNKLDDYKRTILSFNEPSEEKANLPSSFKKWKQFIDNLPTTAVAQQLVTLIKDRRQLLLSIQNAWQTMIKPAIKEAESVKSVHPSSALSKRSLLVSHETASASKDQCLRLLPFLKEILEQLFNPDLFFTWPRPVVFADLSSLFKEKPKKLLLICYKRENRETMPWQLRVLANIEDSETLIKSMQRLLEKEEHIKTSHIYYSRGGGGATVHGLKIPLDTLQARFDQQAEQQPSKRQRVG